MSTLMHEGDRISQLAVKNIWHGQARRMRLPKGMQSFYQKMCSVPLSMARNDLSVKARQTGVYASSPRTTVRDLIPDRDNTFICVEVYGHRLVRVGCDAGLEVLPLENYISSVVRIPGGYACISSENQELFILDEQFAVRKRRRLDKRGMVLDRTSRIASIDDRFVVTNTRRNIIYILEKDFTSYKSVDISHMAYVHDVTGFNGGVVMTESMPGSGHSGGLVWMDGDGKLTSFWGGLQKALNVTTWDGGLVVCDFDGIHILKTDRLAVVGHDFIGWNFFAQTAGEQHGYVCEAVYRSGKITATARNAIDGINAYSSFCLHELTIS